MVASLAALCLVESPDASTVKSTTRSNDFHESWKLFRRDASFRRLCWVTMLFVTMQLLFPHFQALGLHRPGARFADMMVWVVVQNLGTGLFSLLAGSIADRKGNRLAIRLEVFVAAATPLLALGLTLGWFGESVPFWPTFFLLGVVPLTYRTLVNYALELAAPEQHARYVSTLGLCMAIPFLLSPGVGLLTDLIGFRPVFVGVSLLVFAGGLMTFRMVEPRSTSTPDS